MLAVCIAGSIAFGSVLALSFAARPAVERAAAAYLIGRVESELQTQLGDDSLPIAARTLDDLPAQGKEYAVVRPDRVRERLRASLASADPSVADAGMRTYQRLLDSLLDELRLFAAANLAMFLGIAFVCAFRPNDGALLVLPALIAATTTCAAGLVYVFAQDWLWAFLTSSYVGLFYLVAVGLASALLVDIACNRARVSAVLARALWHWPV